MKISITPKTGLTQATVIAVASDSDHNFSKIPKAAIYLVAGLGVSGDAHAGITVKHRSRVAKDPSQPNFRQVHLIHEELFDDLAQQGYYISPGLIGENILTRGIELLDLPTGAVLTIGDAVIELTGLRNPCHQLNQIKDGLMQKLVYKDENDELVRLCGVMGIVLAGGEVKAGDVIKVSLPDTPHMPLQKV